MNQQFHNFLLRLVFAIQQILCQGRRELMTASWIAICVLLFRYVGLLQFLELAALDQLFSLRPYEAANERITIIAIDETTVRQLGSWPISDEKIAQVLSKLNRYKPRAIGLDIYRDLPVQPGHRKLLEVYQSMPNLIGIELLANNKNSRVFPAPKLKQLGQVGFNNVLYDPDGKVRRSLLYWHSNNQAYESLALKLAVLYLKSEGITPQKSASNPEYLQLGKAIFTRFESNNGAYVGSDARGYQILSNFPKPQCQNSLSQRCGYDQVSLVDVLANKVPENLIRDRIILIGSTAPSLQDFLFIPHSSHFLGMSEAKPVSGVQLQAYVIDELISAALQGRPLLKVWSDLLESLWIFLWSFVGTVTVWRIKHPNKNILIFILSGLVLNIIVYIAFLFGWWIPIIPAWLTFLASAIALNFYNAYIQEELKRSKDFLHQVINTIPDPIFVKNQKREWIVLNEAYCQFIGYPYHLLMEKSDYDLFPQHEADIFRQQDQLVFQTHQAQEHEEEFTDANGNTHLIATKRSLHKDAAGNLFLVGVIRDITQRKQIETELKRTADDLSRSNYELKIQENHLRQLAYHDPLTGLSNRKFFTEQLYESLNWSKNNNLMLALLFIDLDGFKSVNDTLGHEMGDHLLVIIAQRLNNALRASDTISRLGGDEFTVILRAISNVQVAATVAEKLLNVITETIILDGHTITVSASIGISIYPINGENSETLIKQADIAMYQAKHLGRNRYQFS
ncbi:CHASE2 domain-containing protein [Sphaerospermopsis aphanizomenoides BCCUSP55]|uniref:CHASE2 domain-containing protein n=1 Tax=Sphaerospermopsis aphanizomenoides TaxID=459663 RepID=UPI000A81108E|nr:CHASE2 domain-containing protein [Sphaerospermopsis aphanizomenoides]MBK1988781.1 CHASE2 domain-containing protein [Sphaerospermopsis aphanizomenoides BCCUSP55]